MKSSFIIFFAIVFTLYALINFYVFIRGWKALQPFGTVRIIYIFAFVILSLSWLAGRIIENYWMSPFTNCLIWIGSFWLGALIYFLLIIILIDISRIINLFFGFLPEKNTNLYNGLKIYAFLSSLIVVSFIVITGYFNSRNPVINKLELKIPKHTANIEKLNIVAVSDIHLGTIIGAERLEIIVDKINQLNPDIVLLVGDVIDEDVKPVIEQNTGEKLLNIKSKYGTYGVTGNHEYFSGVESSCKYLSEHGVIMLRDSVIKIDNSFYLAGREDKEIKRIAGKSRKSLKEILYGIDMNLPVIVMNHQPFALEEAVENYVDLHISGHTHNGQFWPLNYITRLVYKISYGYISEGKTHFYVSNGAGTWGPPLRFGNRPEIVNIMIEFQK